MTDRIELIAETPRAGRWNHRFIAASDSALSDSELTALVAAARENPQGKHYLAVTQAVSQSGGRTGAEILILTGIDTGCLSAKDRTDTLRALEKHLPALEKLVTTQIDWESAGRQMIVKRREFQNWQRRFEKLPVYTSTDSVRDDKGTDIFQSSRIKYILGGLAMVAVLFMIAISISHNWDNSDCKFDNCGKISQSGDRDQNEGTTDECKKIQERLRDKYNYTKFSCEKDKKEWIALLKSYTKHEALTEFTYDSDIQHEYSMLLINKIGKGLSSYIDNIFDFSHTQLSLNKVVDLRNSTRNIVKSFREIKVPDTCTQIQDSESHRAIYTFCKMTAHTSRGKSHNYKFKKLPLFGVTDAKNANYLQSAIISEAKSAGFLEEKDYKILPGLCELNSKFLDKLARYCSSNRNSCGDNFISVLENDVFQKACETLNTLNSMESHEEDY